MIFIYKNRGRERFIYSLSLDAASVSVKKLEIPALLIDCRVLHRTAADGRLSGSVWLSPAQRLIRVCLALCFREERESGFRPGSAPLPSRKEIIASPEEGSRLPRDCVPEGRLEDVSCPDVSFEVEPPRTLRYSCDMLRLAEISLRSAISSPSDPAWRFIKLLDSFKGCSG